ncbi:MAG: hypothetical protein M3O33_14760 [Cyanobacteriota bacterium]|nr:hypothetical protein [Cyanobacteriota bacterium]
MSAEKLTRDEGSAGGRLFFYSCSSVGLCRSRSLVEVVIIQNANLCLPCLTAAWGETSTTVKIKVLTNLNFGYVAVGLIVFRLAFYARSLLDELVLSSLPSYDNYPVRVIKSSI